MYSQWKNHLFVALFSAVALAATAPTSSRAQSFTGLGFVPGANTSIPQQMSADGLVVVGDSPATSFPVQAFRWTAATGMVSLGTLPGQSVTEALGVNADGTVVVGYDGFGGCGNNVAFRWTQATGQVSLGFPPGGGNFSVAYATNADGTVVVGNAGVCGSGNQASRWTAATGWVALGNLPGSNDSQAFGVNADGSVVIGTNNNFPGGTRQAFRWTATSGTVGLGFLPGGNDSGAASVSADGTVVVGFSNGTSGAQAIRWTAATGMVGLGFLPGATNSFSIRVSSDGTVVVGASGGKAFRWTAATGMQSIQGLLVTAGVTNVSGWQLTSAAGVSADGTIISGQGIDPSGQPQGWIATLASPMLQVTPATGIVAAAAQGGGAIFSPASFAYQLSAANGNVQVSISGIPTWLNPSFASATVTTSPLTDTFSLNNLGTLARGTYNATIAFTNTTNHQGDTTRSATLRIYNKDDCKNGGWQNFISPPGRFNNQGQCVSYFAQLQ